MVGVPQDPGAGGDDELRGRRRLEQRNPLPDGGREKGREGGPQRTKGDAAAAAGTQANPGGEQSVLPPRIPRVSAGSPGPGGSARKKFLPGLQTSLWLPPRTRPRAPFRWVARSPAAAVRGGQPPPGRHDGCRNSERRSRSSGSFPSSGGPTPRGAANFLPCAPRPWRCAAGRSPLGEEAERPGASGSDRPLQPEPRAQRGQVSAQCGRGLIRSPQPHTHTCGFLPS